MCTWVRQCLQCCTWVRQCLQCCTWVRQCLQCCTWVRQCLQCCTWVRQCLQCCTWVRQCLQCWKLELYVSQLYKMIKKRITWNSGGVLIMEIGIITVLQITRTVWKNRFRHHMDFCNPIHSLIPGVYHIYTRARLHRNTGKSVCAQSFTKKIYTCVVHFE